MKLRTLLLCCLLLTALFNLILDISQTARLATFTAAVARISLPEAADPTFDARLETSVDPAALRKIARVERAKRQDEYHLLAVLLGSVRRMNGVAVWRSGVLLALAFAAVAASFPVRPGVGVNKKATDQGPPLF